MLRIWWFVWHVAGALPRVAHRVQVLADGFGRDLYPETVPKSLSKLGGVPGALLGEFPFHEGSHFLGYARRVARSRPIGEARKATLLPAAEVAPDALRAAAGVGGDGPHVVAPMREAQHLGAQAHFGFEVRILLYLSESNVLFLC